MSIRAALLRNPHRWLLPITLGAALLPLGCGYELQFQGTDTPTPAPTGGLHVRQIAGTNAQQQQQQPAPVSLIDQLVQRYLDNAGTGASTGAAVQNAPAQQSAPSQNQNTATVAAAPAEQPASPAVARYAGPAQPSADSSNVLPPVVASDSGSAQTSSSSSQNAAANQNANTAPANTSPTDSGPTLTRTLTVAAPQPQVTSVSLIVTFPTGGSGSMNASNSSTSTTSTAAPASSTPTPSPMPTPAPTAPPAPSPPRQPVIIYLQPGPNDFIYVGAAMPINQALTKIAGQYSAVYFTLPGNVQAYVYRPGIDPPLNVLPGTWMRIMFTGAPGTRFAMFPAN